MAAAWASIPSYSRLKVEENRSDNYLGASMLEKSSLDTHDDVVRFGEGRLASGTDLCGSKQLICTVYCYITRQKAR